MHEIPTSVRTSCRQSQQLDVFSLDLAYLHSKCYSASVGSDKTAMLSDVPSLSFGYLQFIFVINGSTGSRCRRSYHGRKPKGTKVIFAIQFGFEYTCKEIEIVSEMTILKHGLSFILKFSLNYET